MTSCYAAVNNHTEKKIIAISIDKVRHNFIDVYQNSLPLYDGLQDFPILTEPNALHNYMMRAHEFVTLT